jgi:hypothetical protein
MNVSANFILDNFVYLKACKLFFGYSREFSPITNQTDTSLVSFVSMLINNNAVQANKLTNQLILMKLNV